jgi:multimeric flavodoxin WrbA
MIFVKVLGLSFGRKLGNTEVFVKEALMGAEAAGAEVEFIRVLDLEIKPCTGCLACVQHLHYGTGKPGCVIKDDFAFLDEKVMESDGLIVGSPIYEKGPQGLLKVLNDRMGPSHDILFNLNAKKRREEQGITDENGPDERFFKPRTAGLIAVGGSQWTTLAVPTMQMFTLSMQMTVIDQVLFDWVANPKGIAALMDDKLQRANRMGKLVAEALLKPIEEAEYVGDPGMCPVCHCKLLEILPGEAAGLCAVCGVKGEIEIVGGEIVFKVSEEERKHSHMLLSGKQEHSDDMKAARERVYENIEELPKRLDKYKKYLSSLKF